MSGLYSIILAGGQGSRLWPLSREMAPKQMLKFNDEYSLLQKTFLNLAGIIDDKNIITSANVKYASNIKEQLKFLQEKFCRKTNYTLLTEPLVKNTAPALSLAVKYINDKFSNSASPVILAVPSDQLIFNREKFIEAISKGIKLAKNGYIVSFISQANEINENFGYVKIRKNNNISEIEKEAFKVINFIEKPSTKEKKEKLKGKIFINSGIYMFTAETYFAELKKHASQIFANIKNEQIKTSIPSITMESYQNMPDISIDYALMEKSKKLAAINLDTEWKDIGSWNAIYELTEKDSRGNVKIGKTIDMDNENSMLFSTSKLVGAIGLKDTFVIETSDALLVCDKNNTNEIKNIYKKLTAKNSKIKEIHKTVYRPWGYYIELEKGSSFLTKCITVNPNAELSLQLHHYRSEHWIVLEGEATVVKGEETYKLLPGESIDIDIEQVHSLRNYGENQLKIIEIQSGDILDENDIERLQDIYGRV